MEQSFASQILNRQGNPQIKYGISLRPGWAPAGVGRLIINDKICQRFMQGKEAAMLNK